DAIDARRRNAATERRFQSLGLKIANPARSTTRLHPPPSTNSHAHAYGILAPMPPFLASPLANPRPRVVFMGTPAFAVPTLDALLAAVARHAASDARAAVDTSAAVATAPAIDTAPTPLVTVVAVFTQPDRPAGRGRRGC
ncbi:MAG: hypothetical protein ABI780_03575, partial [Ardenticatenales bacterium]